MKHEHYYKDVRSFNTIDIYAVLALFDVTDPAEQHAIKKLLLAGGRGAKDATKDRLEAIESLLRGFELRCELTGDEADIDELYQVLATWVDRLSDFDVDLPDSSEELNPLEAPEHVHINFIPT